MVSYAKQRGEMGIYQSLYLSADCRQGEIIYIYSSTSSTPDSEMR